MKERLDFNTIASNQIQIDKILLHLMNYFIYLSLRECVCEDEVNRTKYKNGGRASGICLYETFWDISSD